MPTAQYISALSASQKIVVSSGNITTGTSSSALYTAPANGYAILQVLFSTSAAGINLQIDSVTVFIASSSTYLGNVYVGPGAAVRLNNTSGGTVSCVISGAEFVNYPS